MEIGKKKMVNSYSTLRHSSSNMYIVWLPVAKHYTDFYCN